MSACHICHEPVEDRILSHTFPHQCIAALRGALAVERIKHEATRRELTQAQVWLTPMPCGHIAHHRLEKDACAICVLHDQIDSYEMERKALRAILDPDTDTEGQ